VDVTYKYVCKVMVLVPRTRMLTYIHFCIIYKVYIGICPHTDTTLFEY